MNQALYFLTFCLCIIQINCFAQKENTEIRIEDFGLTSSYYQDNLTLKLLIFKHLNSSKDRKVPIRTILSEECIVTQQPAHEAGESTNDLTSQLNSMGSLTYCITGITKTGDIQYRRTYSGQFHITIDEGTMKR